MKIEVLYFADLKDITGKDKENFILNTNKLSEVVNILLEKHQSFRNIIWDEKNNSLKEIISVAINDSIIQKKEKYSIELSEGDRIAFLLPVSGG
ncbi:MAG: MoaD/ThiS family protein [Candidatus Hodarchaeota archaeon]